MMSIWHLLWIVPAVGSLGAFLMSLFAINNTQPVCEDCPKTLARKDSTE